MSESSKKSPKDPEITHKAELSAASSDKQAATKKTNILKFWKWPKKWIAIGVIFDLAILAALISLIPVTRYMALNLATDASANIIVVNAETSQPIVGATVAIGDTTVETDNDGYARFDSVDYGDQEVSLSKDNYEPATVSGVISTKNFWFEQGELKPTGVSYDVKAVDFLTSEGLSSFTAKIDVLEDSLVTAKDGVATLNVPNDFTDDFTVSFAADGYLSTGAVFSLDEKAEDTKLVRSGRVGFLSNRDGKISVYSSNLDGSDTQLVLEGTGSETMYNTNLSISPNGKYGVLNASREGELDENGNKRNELYLINFEDNSTELFDQGAASWFIYDVNNERAVYSLSKDDDSLEDNRKVKTFTFSSQQLETLVSQKQWGNIIYSNGYVIYSQTESSYPVYTEAILVRVDVATGEKINIETDQRVRSRMIEVSPGIIEYEIESIKSSERANVRYEVATNRRTVLDGDLTVNLTSRSSFTPSPDGTALAWTEIIDGNVVVVVGDTSGNNGTRITTELGIGGLYGWLDGQTVSVLVDGSELHALDIETGNSFKIGNIYASRFRYGYGYY